MIGVSDLKQIRILANLELLQTWNSEERFGLMAAHLIMESELIPSLNSED